jgi:hypothetical protein
MKRLATTTAWKRWAGMPDRSEKSRPDLGFAMSCIRFLIWAHRNV